MNKVETMHNTNDFGVFFKIFDFTLDIVPVV